MSAVASATAPDVRPQTKPDRSHQVPLPPTSRTVYVTGLAALNVIGADDWSGDWHYRTTWFTNVGSLDQRRDAGVALAGEGQCINTNPFLGTLGIRDITHVLIECGFHPEPGVTPVYAANHLRALADWVYSEVKFRGRPLRVNSEFNQWLGKEELFQIFHRDYLQPLKAGMTTAELQAFETWQKTIVWD